MPRWIEEINCAAACDQLLLIFFHTCILNISHGEMDFVYNSIYSASLDYHFRLWNLKALSTCVSIDLASNFTYTAT